jgi:hypothetical protein
MDTLLITLISLFSNLISQIQNFPIQNQQSLITLNPVAVGNSRRRHFDRNVTLTEDRTENDLRKCFLTYPVRISIKLSFGTKFYNSKRKCHVVFSKLGPNG